MNQCTVIICCPYFTPRIGGAETHLYQLSHRLTILGHKVEILTQRLARTPEFERMLGFDVFRFGGADTAADRIEAYRAIRGRALSHAEPVVLYIYLSVGDEFATQSTCELIAEACGRAVPTVVRISSSGRVTELFRTAPDSAEVLRSADAVIALNPGIRQELEELGVSPAAIRYIPNGVDVKLFSPSHSARQIQRRKLSVNEKTLVIIAPSRFASKKRISELLSSWKLLHGRNFRPSELWIVGGDLYERERGRIKLELIRTVETGGEMPVRWMGEQPLYAMPSFYQAADGYITLSEQEGMSNALLEAMACSLVPIVPSHCSTQELVCDEWNGFTFFPATVPTAASALGKFLSASPQRRALMQRRSRRLIEENCELETVVRQFSNLFESLCGRQRLALRASDNG